ncbi:hypothetical protein GOB08_18835 [Sinorhizobium meliloti]|nr:hypothetical protein [Sinorhizobium meliloti]
MKIALLDRLFTIALLLLGLFVTAGAWNYGLYRDNVPGPGFFPAIAGVMMTLLSATLLVRDVSGRRRLDGRIEGSVLLGIAGVTASIIAFVLLTPYTGMAVAAGAVMIIIGYLTEEPERKRGLFLVKLAPISIATVIVCHLIFGIVIRVPLVEGPLGF